MRKLQYLLLVVLVLTIPSQADAGDPGDAGALFLRFGVGARAAGMGEAFSAVALDASALYWNPGAMSAVLSTNLMFTHTEYFQSVRVEQLSLTHETDYGTLGLSFVGLYMDDMDRYEDVPSAIPLGTFSAYDVSFAIGFSRYLIPNLSLGLAVKPVYQKIDQTTATGVAFDAGLFHVSRIEGIRLAAVLANVGAPMKFETEEYALPRVFKLGASYERKISAIKGDIVVNLDVLFPNDGNAKQHIGAEYGYSQTLYLRAGYKAGYDSQGAAFGIGVQYRKFMLDYGVLFGSNDLGDNHKISLSLRV
ncbi:MAG: PorV/PorQ family protein [Candidatus Latescibacterota bacterium]|nr:MAG: PorV/PorQ family protein [Candidatus Latescibacterota bacterium]